MGGLTYWEESFRSVGLFIPPYIQMGVLGKIAADIKNARGQTSQEQLQNYLSALYEPIGLAAMVLHRYPIVPVIQEYKVTIAEAVEAHFLGLDHIAIGGLIPVIEGAGKRLAAQRGLPASLHVKDMFEALGNGIKEESRRENIGAVDEIASLMDSFVNFARETFFVSSPTYPFSDGTNRHGIAHGAFADKDYGSPLNFYKIIAAVDFLTFVGSFRASISCFAPSHTDDSLQLAAYYLHLRKTSKGRPLALHAHWGIRQKP